MKVRNSCCPANHVQVIFCQHIRFVSDTSLWYQVLYLNAWVYSSWLGFEADGRLIVGYVNFHWPLRSQIILKQHFKCLFKRKAARLRKVKKSHNTRSRSCLQSTTNVTKYQITTSALTGERQSSQMSQNEHSSTSWVDNTLWCIQEVKNCVLF